MGQGREESKQRRRAPSGNSSIRVETAEGRVVVARLRSANNFWGKFRGLMLDTSLQADEGLWLTNCRSIHCFFMLMPIDVVFVSADGTVVHLMERMRPWTVSPVVRKARHVLECYPGTIAATQLMVGDSVQMVDCRRSPGSRA